MKEWSKMGKELKKDVPILLVEDDDDDIKLTELAFKKARILNKLYVVHDGEEAMEFLERCGRYAEAPEPGLILLDLNMPRMSGRELLKKIKTNDRLRHIPVVVLTTSDQQKDIRQCYANGANTFITKPVDFDKFLDAIITTGKYWLSIAQLVEGAD